MEEHGKMKWNTTTKYNNIWKIQFFEALPMEEESWFLYQAHMNKKETLFQKNIYYKLVIFGAY